MRKICFFTHSMNNSGGVARVLANVANMLDKQGMNVYIIVMDSSRRSFFKLNESIKLIPLNNELINSFLNGIVCVIKCIFKLRKELKIIKPDIVLAFWTSRAIIAAIATYKMNFPIVACEHTAYCRARIEAKVIRKYIYKYVAAIVTLTEGDAELYKKINKNTYVIPNAVNDLKIRYHNIATQNVVLAVGRWSREKGFDMLIDAWNIIVNSHSDWKLRIVGKKEDHQYVYEVQKKIKQYGIENTIEIKDETSDIMREYDNADIFVLSSRFEGLPMVLLEAMSRGLPAVSFNCPTGPKDIICDGENGILVEANDIAMLAKKIIELIEDDELRRKMGAKANKAIYTKYNEEDINLKWDKMLKEL